LRNKRQFRFIAERTLTVVDSAMTSVRGNIPPNDMVTNVTALQLGPR
jgi:hypothetical protein